MTLSSKAFCFANLKTFPVQRTPLKLLCLTAWIELPEEPLELCRPGVDAADQVRLLCHVVNEGVEGFNVFNVVDRLDVQSSCLTLFRKVKFVLPEEEEKSFISIQILSRRLLNSDPQIFVLPVPTEDLRLWVHQPLWSELHLK